MSPRYPVLSFAAALGAFALALTGTEADAASSGQAQVAPAATLPSQRVPGNGGARQSTPAASAASQARGAPDVQTTVSDGRNETRNANDRHETTDATTPNDH